MRVVTNRELGRPVERLREQMEKLQLHSSHRSERKLDMLEQQLAMAEERVRRVEGDKQAAETRAEIAERRVSTREVRSWRKRNKSELREELSTLLNLFSSTKDSFYRLLTYRGEQKRQREEPEMQRIPLLTSSGRPLMLTRE